MEKKFDAVVYKNEFARQNYDRIALQVAKGKKETYKKVAQAEGLSLNAWITQTLDREVEAKEK